jgi:hypothetical protein
MRIFHNSLTPQGAGQKSGSRNQSQRRPRSPSGTTPTTNKQGSNFFGPEIYLQTDDDSPAQQHQIEDVSAKPREKVPNPPAWATPALAHQVYAPNEDHSNCHVKGESRVRHQDFSSGSNPRIETFSSDERADNESIWSESNTNVPRRNLNSFDVAALIFNKMVRMYQQESQLG